MNKPFAELPVNIIDSMIITEETDTSIVLAEWGALDPSIMVYKELQATQAAKLFVNWSDKNGTIALQQGDYFTFIVPDIFMYELVHNVTDVEIKNELGEAVATYSIYDNDENMKKEVKITFTDYADTHTDISGSFWILLFVGRVDSVEQKKLEFIINGNLEAEGKVTVKPTTPAEPRNQKVGFSLPTRSAEGYYIFEWTVYLNMRENVPNGFNAFENFSYNDIIPTDSPHIFLTDEIRQELGILSSKYSAEIGEYTGADTYPPENRYQAFIYHYNSTGENIWYRKIDWHALVNGLTTVGIDGNNGLNVSDIEVSDKLFSAKLGTLTRPVIIRYYTISTVKLSESSLGDSEVVGLFNNRFEGSTGEDLFGHLEVYRFEAGGSAQGISGDYSFSFTKVNERGAVLPGAMFSLFISEDISGGADRIVYSGEDGVVAFRMLPEGTYYVQETVPPYGYISDGTIYKVVLSSKGFEIYYGDNYEKKLSDQGNKIANKLAVEPVAVTLRGTKSLTGKTLSGGMFSFVARDNDGAVSAIGSNDASGSINFSEIEFDTPGVYTYTVEEIRGAYGGITYDDARFTVTVRVEDDGKGKLTAEVATYPDGGIVFNNRYIAEPVSVTLTGTKKLTGKTLSGGMFGFVARANSGAVSATGTNDANGSIIFSEIKFDSPGVYSFTIEEIMGGYSGITYDSSKFTVTITVEDDGNGKLTAKADYPYGGAVFNNSYAITPVRPCQCYARATKCRKSIIGQKIWIDNDNAEGKRPLSVEIVLLRDGEVYKRIEVDSAGDGAFVFCCLPIWKNSSHKYNYRIDETTKTPGYTKTIEGYDVINTLTL